MNRTTYRSMDRALIAIIAILGPGAVTTFSGCAPKPAVPTGLTQSAESRNRQVAFLQQQLIVLQNDKLMPADQKAKAEQTLQAQIGALTSPATH